MTAPKWQVQEDYPLHLLKAYEHNPRQISKAQFEKLRDSINQDGYHQPIIANTDGIIIGGHQRAEVMRRMGITKVRVMMPDRELIPEEFDRINIRDNLPYGEFDFNILGNRFDIETLADWGMPIEMLAGLTPQEHEEESEELPELGSAATAISQKGQIWIMGNHRLMCGDSTIAADVESLLGAVKPHLMVTDPPYGVEYDADWRNKALGEGKRAIGKVTNDATADWSLAYALFPGDVAYVWHSCSKAHVVAQNLIDCGFDIRTQIIWAKSHFAIGRGHYHVQHEPCWYAVRKKSAGSWVGDRKQSTLWQIDKPQRSETGHSTQKPIECMRKPMENNSSPGQAVYEPFCGSGTSLIAAEQIGRHCYAMEIAPEYVDMAVKRWQNFTGQEAVCDESGKKFKDFS